MELSAAAKELIDRLGVLEKLLQYEERILQKIGDEFSKGEPETLLPRILPLGSGCMAKLSSLENYENARAWVVQHLPGVDPGTTMASLIVLYLAEKGQKKFKGITEKQQMWETIRRVVALSQSGD